MLTELKFVQGSIAKKDFLPALTHFAIENGTVRGYNGVLALCSPIPFDITCKPKAEPLIKAIANCLDTVQLAMTPAGRLSIKSGKFKAFIDCIEQEGGHVHPEGESVVINGAAMLRAFKMVAPFIGNDASRPWSNGVLLKGQSVFATNNVTLVEYWTETTINKSLNIPRAAIKEMLRIDEAPISAQLTDNSITFHYEGDRWLRTQLLVTDWPDLQKVLERASNPQPVHPDFFVGLQTIKPFTDKMGRVLFSPEGKIRTHIDETEGAGYELDGFVAEGIYPLEILMLLEGTVKTIDWGTYPAPCMFFGDCLRGALIGMRS